MYMVEKMPINNRARDGKTLAIFLERLDAMVYAEEKSRFFSQNALGRPILRITRGGDAYWFFCAGEPCDWAGRSIPEEPSGARPWRTPRSGWQD